MLSLKSNNRSLNSGFLKQVYGLDFTAKQAI